jgi:hypothetical protein
MSGMRTSHGQGPGRSVQDGSYFFGVLRQKVTRLYVKRYVYRFIGVFMYASYSQLSFK